MKNSYLMVVMFAMGALMLSYSFMGENSARTAPKEINYSTFLNQVEKGNVSGVDIIGGHVSGKYFDSVNGHDNFVVNTPRDPAMIKMLHDNKVSISVRKPESNLLLSIFISWFPMLLMVGFLVWMIKKQASGGLGGVGKSNAKLLNRDQKETTFKDVAGCEEAKGEVADIVDFLKQPDKYTRLGGKIPKGVILTGPPGTGKTLMAKAVAGEAHVPFFSVSGSDFVQMFVGVGASRVRDMFTQARKNAPCIIFIDEIDAMGKKRSSLNGGGDSEREQTLNQMLVEMDGFDNNGGVVLMAATNRVDTLDPALMRPGRFDREITVPKPDLAGRIEILKVHLKKIPHASTLDVAESAKGTPGFSGADLANLVNEAALNAAKRGADNVERVDMEYAKDKVLMGVERKTAVISDEQKKTTAYHEAGHTIVAKYVTEADPVHKVSVIPRGRALGVTIQLPETDKLNHSSQYLHDKICILMGGRVAEELALHQKTTGASNDFEVASNLARNMVEKWGMSDQLGPLVVSMRENMQSDVSQDMARKIDTEIIGILNDRYQQAVDIITEHYDEFEKLTQSLIKYETLDLGDIDRAMAGEELQLVPTVATKSEVDVDDDTDADGTENVGQKEQNDQDSGRGCNIIVE